MTLAQANLRVSSEAAAFNIGWDAGMYGLEFREEWPIELRPGWAAARQKYPRPKGSDRFIRKWIQLRANAYLRGKFFSDRVTPGYLQAIDSPVCPVTLVELTHGEESDKDWSVDRVDNARGYEQKNLVVMSARANLAKADMSFDQIRAIAFGKRRVDPLSNGEWMRLCLVVAQFVRTDHQELDLSENYYWGQALLPDAQLNWIMSLQILICAGMSPEKGNVILAFMELAACQSGLTPQFRKFAKRCLKYCSRRNSEDSLKMWGTKSVQLQFMNLLLQMKPQAIAKLKRRASLLPDLIHRRIELEHVESWARE